MSLLLPAIRHSFVSQKESESSAKHQIDVKLLEINYRHTLMQTKKKFRDSNTMETKVLAIKMHNTC